MSRIWRPLLYLNSPQRQKQHYASCEFLKIALWMKYKLQIILLLRQMRQLTFSTIASLCLCYGTTVIKTSKGAKTYDKAAVIQEATVCVKHKVQYVYWMDDFIFIQANCITWGSYGTQTSWNFNNMVKLPHMLLILCMSTAMISNCLSRPSETPETSIFKLSVTLGALPVCWKMRISAFSWQCFKRSCHVWTCCSTRCRRGILPLSTSRESSRGSPTACKWPGKLLSIIIQ